MWQDFKGELQRKPPLRKDQHPFLATTLAIHFGYASYTTNLVVIAAESIFFSLTHLLEIPIFIYILIVWSSNNNNTKK